MKITEIYIIIFIQIYLLGLVGLFTFRTNVVYSIIFLEILTITSGAILGIAASIYGDNFVTITVLFILAVTACESAIGLSVLIRYYKLLLTNITV